MTCPSCGHENREGARFCLSCGGELRLSCARCSAQLPPGARFCDTCGQPVGEAPQPAPERDPRDYTPKHLAEKILRIEVRPRRRAQAGDGAVRRRKGLDGAGGAGRRRGVASHPRPLLRDPGRRRAPLRGHRQSIHRRRHHGALRCADRARGPRAAGVLRRAPHLRQDQLRPVTADELRRDARAELRGADRPQLRRGRWSARSATTCAWTTRPRATP